jgi:hypothetical protein
MVCHRKQKWRNKAVKLLKTGDSQAAGAVRPLAVARMALQPDQKCWIKAVKSLKAKDRHSE